MAEMAEQEFFQCYLNEKFEQCAFYRKQFQLREDYSAIYDLLADESFQIPSAVSGLRDYSISFFGVPVLYSVKCGVGYNTAFRVIFEPGGREISVAQQVDKCLGLVGSAAAQLHWSAEAADCINRAVRLLFPEDEEETRSWEGGMWLGLDTADDPVMLRLYISLRHFSVQEGWQRLADLFGEFADRDMEPVLLKVIERAAAYGNPVGVCCGFSARGLEGVRFYSCMSKPTTAGIDELAETFFPGRHDEVSVFCRNFVEQFGEFEPQSVTVGFDFAADGCLIVPQLARIKFELSCCLFSGREQEELPGWIKENAFLPCDTLGQQLEAAGNCLKDIYFHYVSVGLRGDGKKHLTLYFEPYEQFGRFAYKLGRLTTRIRSFLIHAQEQDGAWRAFELFPGKSDAWVTAYIGLCLLEDIRPPQEETAKALRKARSFLRGAYREGYGWGYNSSVRCDCDSTAHAILFLLRMQERYPEGTELEEQRMLCPELLLRFQKDSGGFSTYDEKKEDGWNAEQPDITAFTMQVLSCLGAREQAKSAQNYLKQWRKPIPSYWWISPYYAALKEWDAKMVFGDCGHDLELERILLESDPPESTFDLSLYIELLCKLTKTVTDGKGKSRLLERIVKTARCLMSRESGGQFEPQPILKVPPRAEITACGAAGSVYEDENGVFTAATAMRALRVCRSCVEREEFESDDATDKTS